MSGFNDLPKGSIIKSKNSQVLYLKGDNDSWHHLAAGRTPLNLTGNPEVQVLYEAEEDHFERFEYGDVIFYAGMVVLKEGADLWEITGKTGSWSTDELKDLAGPYYSQKPVKVGSIDGN